jgi:signal peptidase
MKITFLITNILLVLFILIIVLNVLGLIMLGIVEGPSMEPLFQTGDLVIIVKSNNIDVGDIIVFKKKIGNGYIIHRVISVNTRNGTSYYVTKGDNNPLPDYQEFEALGIPQERVVGKVLEVNGIPVKIPMIGYLSLILRRVFSI